MKLKFSIKSFLLCTFGSPAFYAELFLVVA